MSYFRASFRIDSVFAVAYQRDGNVQNVDLTQPLFWLYLAIFIVNWALALFVLWKFNREGKSVGQSSPNAIFLSAIGFSLIHGIFFPDKLVATFLLGWVGGYYYTRERTEDD